MVVTSSLRTDNDRAGPRLGMSTACSAGWRDACLRNTSTSRSPRRSGFGTDTETGIPAIASAGFAGPAGRGESIKSSTQPVLGRRTTAL